ncbi:dihydrodipicolinate synthase family protein [Actinokineospora guangxiensis]|uniref:Dihydrodipicolinate synthase family protein n=1 Tax=Actinokineospora guangxiensis TaxID=1490288 RepID=A0ABW0ETJ7_9PSEU
MEQLADELAGVVAIPVTPFGADGGVDTAGLQRVLRRIVDGGVRVVTPNGNTGEYYALTSEETRLAVDVTADTVGAEATIVAGVGGPVPSAVQAARYALSQGAKVIMVHQPVHPYVSAEGWIEYHRAIATAVPELAVMLYVRNPRITGTAIARLRELAPNVLGVKYAVADPVRFGTVAREAGPGPVWIAGLAESAAPGYFALGATGFTSGLVNIAPEISVRLLGALREHGDVVGIWRSIQLFEQLRAAGESENNVSVVKEALAQIGVCRRDVRPPSSPVDARTRELIGEVLVEWGLA